MGEGSKRTSDPFAMISDRQMSSSAESVLSGVTTQLPLKVSAVRRWNYHHGQRGLSEFVAGKLRDSESRSTGKSCSDGANCS